MSSASDETSMGCESVYVLPDDLSAEALTRSLQALLPVRYRPIAPHRLTFLDTFDGRIRRAGARLTANIVDGSRSVAWQSQHEGTCLEVQLTEPPSFIWDLPKGSLQQILAPIVGARRLFAQADAERFGTLLEILDRRSKTVARLRIESGQARVPTSDDNWQALPTIVTLTGLRGYADEYIRLKPVIESRPGLQSCPEGLLALILRQVGAPLRNEGSLPQLNLSGTIPAEVGARQIHLALLEIMRANEPGLRSNLDTEFLHDFRVAIRRTRSLLGQIKGVFAAEAVEHFAREFSWIGRLTGPPRDLDVLLLAVRERREEFPAADMNALFDFLGQRQQEHHLSLREALDSDRFSRLLSEWESFLRQPVLCEAGGRPRLRGVVSSRAWRLSRRIVRSAKIIDDNTAAARLHEVRIAAKKLRYLIDITPTFYDAVDLKRILNPLKKVQRVLGDFNDARLQEKWLLQCRGELAAAGGPQGALVVLRRLAVDSRRRRAELRTQVADSLSRFRAKKTRSACRRAFKGVSAS